jgi:hypothetical protein
MNIANFLGRFSHPLIPRLTIVMLIALATAVASCSSFVADKPVPVQVRQADPQLTIDGVGLGTELAAVKARYGMPRDETTPKHDPVDDTGMGPENSLRYDGVVMDVCKPDGDSDFHVWRMIVTGNSRKLSSGMYVGMSRASALSALGPPESSSRENQGVEVLHYSFYSFDGWYWLKIEKDLVIEIGMVEDWS